tara:strand:+ start:470 stop:1006 length:537 start_codon:yes stop_codon:yes gene_type:complete
MSVPTTGTISEEGLAQERLYGTYGSGTVSNPVKMTELLSSGGLNNFPAKNVACGNVVPNGSFESWRGYCQGWLCYYPTGSGNYTGIVPTRTFNACVPNPSGTTTSYWASAQLTNATTGAGWTVNSTILYNNANQPDCGGSALDPLANKTLVIYYAGGATPNCYVETNGSGVITSINTC